MNTASLSIPDKRCAIYTRKSTAAGLDSDFNSLDAQRETCENYIRGRAHEGWRILPNRYDDGNFTGANMDRPALQQLLADVEAERVDVIVTYKVDRVSRSLIDFLKLMELFEKKNISFASVTQHFSTADAMGRLTLNILMSFAEFEREMIADRTRDKIAASKRHGKWTGGIVPFGYRIVDKKLVIEPLEASVIRDVVSLYLEHDSVVRVAQLINERGQTFGFRRSKSGQIRHPKPWTNYDVRRILMNPIYAGYIACGDTLHLGQHEAIIQKSIFDEVQRVLTDKQNKKQKTVRNFSHLLSGLLRCAHCSAAYTPTTTNREGTSYRYYRCITRDQQGKDACANRSIPADAIESVVLDRVRSLIQSGELDNDVYQHTKEKSEKELTDLAEERKGTLKLIGGLLSERKQLEERGGPRSEAQNLRLQYLNEEVAKFESRISEIDRRRKSLEQGFLEANWISEVLQNFDGLWELMTPINRYRLVHALIKEVKVDVPGGDYAIEMRQLGTGV